MQCSFITSIGNHTQKFESELPLVCIMGRSNCGKSSLINALANHKTLARAAKTPGRTRLVNLFDMNGKIVLADLPGYGYARISKGEQQKWHHLTNYFFDKHQIDRMLLLHDIRHFPGEDELAFWKDASENYQTTVVSTKMDKLKPRELKTAVANLEEFIRRHRIKVDHKVQVSSLKKTNIEQLREHLELK